MSTKQTLIDSLVEEAMDTLDDHHFRDIVHIPDEDTPEEKLLITTLENFFTNLVDNLRYKL